MVWLSMGQQPFTKSVGCKHKLMIPGMINKISYEKLGYNIVWNDLMTWFKQITLNEKQFVRQQRTTVQPVKPMKS